MVAKFEQGKTYRHGTAGEPLECLWAGTSDGRGAQPLPPFPSGWAVLWRSGDSSREDAEAYSRRFAH